MELELSSRTLLLAIVLPLVFSACASAEERVYYIGIVERDWDYSPAKTNNITGLPITADSPEADYVIQSSTRIGSVYKKAFYREFTDDSYTVMKERPDWMGFLGPMIYAEVGDTIKIHARNMATKEFAVHPHGVFYLKDSEGAVYEDGTSGKDKLDERISPGGSHIYTWEANERAGPAEGGPNCVPWIYHSHIDTPYGTNSGALGFMLICREGILDDNNKRTDVEEDFVLMFTVTDENMSYYIDENIATYITGDVDPEDEDFLASNRMDSVNGYVYGALPGLEICQGDKVAWHLMSLGTEVDIHTVNFHGNVLELRNHRVDTLSLTPAVIASADMVAVNPGTWLLKSHVVTHQVAGAQALYTVTNCGSDITPEPLDRGTREYYIGVDESVWNYGPTGVDGLNGVSLTDPNSTSFKYFTDTENRIPGTYKKARYVEYTDDTFTELVVRTAAEEHMGILGPAIKGQVGETLRVTFRNRGSRPYSIHPMGVMYNKASEGSIYADGTDESMQADGSVAPGQTYVYNWTIPESFGPTNNDENCVTRMYLSGINEIADMYTGLVGPMLICKPGTLDQNGHQIGVDLDVYLLFIEFDESQSWFFDENIATYAPNADKNNEDFINSNNYFSINGYIYANVPTIEMTEGQTISWHTMDLGKSTDLHIAYIHESVFVFEGRRIDYVPLFPGISHTVTSVADNPGSWVIECALNEHLSSGMVALYTINPPPTRQANEPLDGVTRTYYIAAVEMEWDYTPDLWDPVRSEDMTDPNSAGYVFVTRSDTTIGSKYRKALYRQYTDERFITPVKRTSNEDMSLGLLGPVIRAEVGDTIKVVFKNLATMPYSMHPQDLYYNKSSEGAPYGDELDAAVQPGETKTYVWTIPESRAPTDNDIACTASLYYSHVQRGKDTNAGLVGPLVICKRGNLDADGRRTDVDKEFNLYFTVLNENKSWYLKQNINHYCYTPDAVDTHDADFEESNLMHGINGYLYNNLHHLEMVIGDKIAWNLLGLGDEVDLHTVHFHGHTLTYQTEHTNRLDVSELFPGTYLTVEMIVDDPGTWLLHCHVNDHIIGGMEAFYYVLESEPTTPAPTTESAATTVNRSNIASVALLLIIGLFYSL